MIEQHERTNHVTRNRVLPSDPNKQLPPHTTTPTHPTIQINAPSAGRCQQAPGVDKGEATTAAAVVMVVVVVAAEERALLAATDAPTVEQALAFITCELTLKFEFALELGVTIVFAPM